MAKRLQFRRGTTAQHSVFTGAVGEITIDTDKDVPVVHDGYTVGGFPGVRESVVNTALGNKVDKNANIVAGTGTKITYDAKGLVTGSSTPTTLAGYSIGDAYTKTETDSKIAALVDSAPGTLDTLNELAAALGDDPNFATTVTNSIAGKASTAYVDNGLALKTNKSDTDSVNLIRADKYLAAQNIANMLYTSGDLTKIRYKNNTDVDYEVLGYTSGNLTTIQHFVTSVLRGTTTLSYSGGNLVSAVFVAV
jgi:hypothetical protein